MKERRKGEMEGEREGGKMEERKKRMKGGKEHKEEVK